MSAPGNEMSSAESTMPAYPLKKRVISTLPFKLQDGGIPFSKLIAPFIKTLRLEETRSVNHLQERWESTVGKAVAAHTRPGILNNGDLTIYVDSSPWLSELKRYASRELLANLQTAFGKDVIRTVRLQLDPGR